MLPVTCPVNIITLCAVLLAALFDRKILFHISSRATKPYNSETSQHLFTIIFVPQEWGI
jgi:hypothetical protein